MKKVFLLYFLFSFFPHFSLAQEKPVAVINGQQISAGELLYAYKKNLPADSEILFDSLNSYLDKYIDFKLKVQAAAARGIDTTELFKSEYNSYTQQLRKPYLSSPELEEGLIEEAYDHLKYEIRASHILVRLPNPASPTDTLIAYNRIDSLRNLAINGAPFDTLAIKNSQDGSARIGGDLGYFTGFSMVYPFEKAAFGTPLNGVSEIVKTAFGYHILKVTAKRPARGNIATSHIMITKQQRGRDAALKLAQTVYDSLQNGMVWELACQRYSEDRNSNKRGGKLAAMGVGRLPEPYLKAAFALASSGDYSKPIETSAGWHIIRLDNKEPVLSFDELKAEIREKVKRSGRNRPDQASIAKRLKKENGFVQNAEVIQGIIAGLANSNDSIRLSRTDRDLTLFELGERTGTLGDFIDFLHESNIPKKQTLSEAQIWKLYGDFEYSELIRHEESLIYEKYPEHGYLLQEYKEGLMLFSIMEEEVWNKALADSTGLEAYFKKNRRNFPAPVRFEIEVIQSDSVEFLKGIRDMFAQSREDTSLEENVLNHSALKIAKRKFEMSDLPIFARSLELTGDVALSENGKELYHLTKIVPAGYYELGEIKGLAISAYQDFLEEEWVKSLRKKAQIKIHKSELKRIVTNE